MGKYLDIDTTEAEKLLEKLKKTLTEKEMEKLQYRVVSRTGQKVKSIVSTDVPKKYHIKKGEVAKDIGRPKMGTGEGNVACTIPIEGTRHIIGGKTFTARGGRHGWNVRAGKRYKITAQIVKGKASVLPTEMENYGDNPPFRNLSAKRLSNGAFVREKGAGFPPHNLPVARIVGIAVPQMPMNRSKDEVQNDIMEHMIQRIEHEYKFITGKLR